MFTRLIAITLMQQGGGHRRSDLHGAAATLDESVLRRAAFVPVSRFLHHQDYRLINTPRHTQVPAGSRRLLAVSRKCRAGQVASSVRKHGICGGIASFSVLAVAVSVVEAVFVSSSHCAALCVHPPHGKLQQIHGCL
jgi:hypothetical protein